MEYKDIKPHVTLAPFIHSFWELKGNDSDNQWERIFPDGCPGLLINLGDSCKTDNGAVSMDHGKTYAVGAMTSFKDSFINADTHLLGVCLKPGAFPNFYNYASQHEITNNTVQFDTQLSFNIDEIIKDSYGYLNKFFANRLRDNSSPIQSVIEDIHNVNGQLSIYDVAKKNCTTLRQLERNFKARIGLTPKEYAKIIRFQSVLSMITDKSKSLAEIAFECGFYDHAHLTNEIKKHTGLTPSQL